MFCSRIQHFASDESRTSNPFILFMQYLKRVHNYLNASLSNSPPYKIMGSNKYIKGVKKVGSAIHHRTLNYLKRKLC